MRPYACWEEREIARTLVDDANRDAPAVFSAVHRPARVLRKDIRQRATDPGAPVDEHAVLEALLGGDPEADRIIPIVGESGTGKSHLIRWLHANIDERKDRQVVYIEKRGTSLRQVIHKILDGLDRPEIRHRERFAELSAEVDKAAEGLEPAHARMRLLYELGHALREHGTDNAEGDEDREDREDLAEGLADLITDPVFRGSLLEDDGVIARTVERALGRGTSDGEAPAFERLDLSVDDITKASGAAQEVRSDIYAEQATHDLAVRMLNEQLNPALGALIGVDRTQVYDVMLQVREALLDEGRTLILLVEDFALLRGVETQLLDAMIADAETLGDRKLCPMRSAIAVTSGYFEGKDTALTRIHSRGGYVYSLDAELGKDARAVSPGDLHGFVATYLNAARVGRGALETAFRSRNASAEDKRGWVPNACMSCSFMNECHEGFGEVDGYGLYPFNAATLDRIAHSQFARFDPRHLLSILDATLTGERQPILDGEFPSAEWAAPYDTQQIADRPPLRDLPAAVGTEYERRDPVNAERRKVLATFWGGVPEQPVNLHAAIHDAFAIPRLDGLETAIDGDHTIAQQTPETPQPAPEPSGGKPSDEPSATELDRTALDSWGAGRGLDQERANRVRRELANAVKGARDWAALGVDARALDRVVSNTAFSLPTAKGEAAGTPQLLATLKPNDKNAFLLQGVLEAERRGDWSFDRGLDRFVRLSNLVEEWAERAMSRLREPAAGTAVVRLLLLSGAVLGTVSPDDDREQILASLFVEPAPVRGTDHWSQYRRQLVDGPSGSSSRSELAELLRTRYRLARSVDRTEGDTIALDAAPLAAAIDATSVDGWEFPPPDALAREQRDVQRYAEAIRRDLRTNVRERLDELAAARARAFALLGDERVASSVADAVDEALQQARFRGVGPRLSGIDEREVQTRFRAADLAALDRLAALDDISTLTWAAQLSLLVAADKEDLGAIDAYVNWAEAALDESQAKADAKLAGEGETDASVGAATRRIVAVLRELAAEFEEART